MSAPKKVLITLSLPTNVGMRMSPTPNAKKVLEVELYRNLSPSPHQVGMFSSPPIVKTQLI